MGKDLKAFLKNSRCKFLFLMDRGKINHYQSGWTKL